MQTREILLFLTFSILLTVTVAAQRIAVLTPDDSGTSRRSAEIFEKELASRFTVLDDDLARAAFDSAGLAAPFNLSLDEAKRVGKAMGCDLFLLVRAGVQRRSSFEKQEYYEASVAFFLVSTRTGRLVEQETPLWIGATPAEALTKLERMLPGHARTIGERAKEALAAELSEKPPPIMEEPPDPSSPLAKKFRAPVPYSRQKPEYTKLAESLAVTATVDISIDLDAEGRIIRTEIVRWAGYDLDGSVEKTVRGMNWRPAERDGKFVPMRFLVRYNFKKPEKTR